MNNEMNEAFEGFEAELKDLKPEVREKALELAEQLIKNQQIDKKRALTEAIPKAEAWFLDSEG